ncbi:MAG: zinc-binding dehydrogenase [Alicyclobacillus macrosporangiidus]|uniref:zinc-dependent alcohol dehydrogenase n=1 Tax=Alicyclobacillus macrosporangiidus TaxID=392015 RepID=UPI0026ED8748|nr:zinc-binding dehydrogenase [Alicyclobacillus macrosporangiidus]MCL6598141.1 zinc-binding dehydrogenase [Alicyclobacillus macrosporangiidus]
MADKVYAAVAVAPERTAVQALDLPEIGEDEGLLKVETVGVCGTDVSVYRQLKEPRILGHHVIGYVAKIGARAAQRWGVREGDRVAMEEYIPCGQCDKCRTGLYRSCDFTDSKRGGLRYGNTPLHVAPGLWGGFSQYMYLHPNAVLHRMPAHVKAVEAALTLPLANGFEWMCIEGRVGVGSTVVVLGPGQQGLACVLAAKAAGAEKVICVGRRTSLRRLELARELGADEIVNISEEDLIGRVREMTGGEMADVVIDVTSGGTEPITQALHLAKKRGQVLWAAYKYQAIPAFDADEVVAKTLTIKGLRGHSYESVEMAIRLIASGRFPIWVMNSHDYPLERTHEALQTAGGRGEPNPLLVTVSP